MKQTKKKYFAVAVYMSVKWINFLKLKLYRRDRPKFFLFKIVQNFG